MPSVRDIPLFIVSPRHAAGLGALCERAGWSATVLDHVDVAPARFALDPATVAVVDTRDAPESIDVVRALAGPIEQRRGCLLVLLDPRAAADAAVEFGATQLATGPFTSDRLLVAFRLAMRERARLAAAGEDIGTTPARAAVTRSGGLVTAAEARDWVERLIGFDDAPDPAAIVLQLAIGRFGQLNAAYGRSVADAALRLVEQRLYQTAATMMIDGSGDGRIWATRIVTRLAGAEFAVVLAPPTTLADAATLAGYIARAFDVPFIVDGHSIHLGCRIGIAAARTVAGPPAIAAETAFRHASIALALARVRAPGAVEVFRAHAGDPMRRMADLESDLRTAIAAGEVEVRFQPQVEIDSGQITGVEALVRWQHPVLGELPAETLLEVAESAEFATRLGSYIQQQALSVAAQWPPALGALRLAVNVTARDLAMPEFVDGLDAALALSGFPAARLTLELTESDLIENLDATADVLAAVSRRGIEVALDDFGTGYSSLAYLKALPLDCLKVDKRLVSDLAGSPRDRVVVKGVVDMAHTLGMRVVAEGIETEEQRARIAAAGCDGYQGFLCAAPMRAASLAGFVASWNLAAGGS